MNTTRIQALWPLCLCLVLAVPSCSRNGKQDNGADAIEEMVRMDYETQVNEVSVMTLRKSDFHRQLLSNGTLCASRKAAVQFGTSGRIGELNVKNGDRVGQGSVMARLERPDLDIALESAQLALKRAELDLSDFLAGQGYKVGDTTSVPADLLETGRIRSGYSSSLNQLASVRNDLEGTVLKAPFSGRVADLASKKFDNYSSGPFCTIVDDSSLDVNFTVLESEYSFLSPGLPVTVKPYADQKKEYSGTITSINPSVDEKGQVTVTARVRNDGFLIDGMSARVIVERSIPDQLVVPRSAVVIRDNLEVLFKCSPEGRAQWTYVTILYSNGDSYAVEANKDRYASLEEGDVVIVSGNLNLADNSEVKVNN